MSIDFFEYCDLIDTLNKWNEAYAAGTPVVSDAVYDVEYQKLKQFERANPDQIEPNSPTLKVTSDLNDGFVKVKHEIPMLSIANSMGYGELREWSEKTVAKGGDKQTIEFKIDGLALELRYENGALHDAITRGNGTEGDSVYANALQIPAIPKSIPWTHSTYIRGECVWFKDEFNAYNEKLESMGKELLSNPRNGAAGTMKSRDPREVAERKLSFVAYSIAKGSDHKLHSEDLDWLKSVGFTISEYYICPNTDKVIAGAEYMETKRHMQPFLIDGLVIKVNDKSLYKKLGGTAKTPHCYTALKFPPEEKETKLLGIEHSYGRTGAVTPVALLETVELALTNVSRASLHNWDLAEYLGCFVGCHVVVRKAGEIIPEIVKVVEIGRTKDDYEKALYKDADFGDLYMQLHEGNPDLDFYTRPRVCAHCGTPLQNHQNRSGENLVSWICPNSACTIKQFKQIVKFVGKEAMNIMGVGESLIESMLSAGLIKNAAGLFQVTKDDLLTLDGMKDRSAQKAIDAINDARNAYLNQLLAGIGIPNLGKTSSAPIADAFKTLKGVSKASIRELSAVSGVGQELAESIAEWFYNPDNMAMIQWFIDNNVACNAKPSRVKSDKLKDLVLIMTGSCEHLSRDDFKDLVVEYGGKVASSITKNVTHVIIGQEGAGPAKLKKINDLQQGGHGIKIISDLEFLALLQ